MVVELLPLVIGGCFFFIYLYVNFSGYCDLTISLAKITGIKIEENFNQPFKSQNVQEFWTRWHMTLSTLIKQVFFNQLLIYFGRKVDIRKSHWPVNLSLIVTFIAVGLWHGFSLNYASFGLMHGVAVVANVALPKNRVYQSMSKQLGALFPNWVIIFSCRTITFIYIGASFAFFEIDLYSVLNQR